jgi:hypothetical protein
VTLAETINDRMNNGTESTQLLTSSELGDWLGLTDVAVSNLARRRVIERTPNPCDARRYLYPLRKSVSAYCDYLRNGQLSEARKLEFLKLRMKREEQRITALQRSNGELLEVEDVRAACTMIRRKLLAIPNRLPDLSDEQRETLRSELLLTLDELAALAPK